MMLHNKCQGSRPNDFWDFAYVFIWKANVTHVASGGAGPCSAIILTNLVEVQWVMLNAKYQGSRPDGFR